MHHLNKMQLSCTPVSEGVYTNHTVHSTCFFLFIVKLIAMTSFYMCIFNRHV